MSGSARLSLSNLSETLIRSVLCSFFTGKDLARFGSTSKLLQRVCDGHSIAWQALFARVYACQPSPPTVDASELDGNDAKDAKSAAPRVNWQKLYAEVQQSVLLFNTNANAWSVLDWLLLTVCFAGKSGCSKHSFVMKQPSPMLRLCRGSC